MPRKIVAPLMLSALVAATAAFGAGCTAQFGNQPQTPPPAPPPAPVATPAAAPAPPPPVVEPPKAPAAMGKDGRISIPGNIVYETGKAVIKPESEPTLNALKDFIDHNANFSRIRIEGHTDNVGKSPDNLKLSQDRAQAVVAWLAVHGVSKDRVLAVGFGDAKPIADNSTEDGRAQNRRTEFHLSEIEGKPFMGRDESGGGTVVPGQTPYPVKK
jgi:OOP family OmpA-OmpF porin